MYWSSRTSVPLHRVHRVLYLFTLYSTLYPVHVLMAQSVSIQNKSELQARIDALSPEHCRDALAWLNLSAEGSEADCVTRLKGYATGPSSRHRAGWLQLSLDAVADGQEDDCAVPGVEHLWDLRERLDTFGLLPSCIPMSIFPDLKRELITEDDAERVSYSLPPGYRWFSVADISAFLGVSTDDVTVLKQEIETLKSTALFSGAATDTADLMDKLREGLAIDVAENRFAVGAGSTIAVQRKTLAFLFNPDQFYLYSYKLHDTGRSRDLIPGAVNQAWIRKHLLDSQVTPEDLKKMDRRSLVPEDIWTQAYTRDIDSILVMGGESSPAFKADESKRIQQQALLRKIQHIVHVLAACSRAHHALESVLISAGPGATMPTGDATALGFVFDEASAYQDTVSGVMVVDLTGRDVLDRDELAAMRTSRDALCEALFAASDSFHIFAAELSELERQRDDGYAQARSGNKGLKVARPSSDVTKYTKSMGALDKLADAELLRQKNLQALHKPDFRGDRPKPTPRKGQRSASDRKAQSARDKAASSRNRDRDRDRKPKATPRKDDSKKPSKDDSIKKPFVKQERK